MDKQMRKILKKQTKKFLKRQKKDFWAGIPDELRCMCLAEGLASGHYFGGAVIKYLVGRLYDCDRWILGVTPQDILQWIDVGFEHCLFPLEYHWNDWCENKTEIHLILTRAEELMEKYAPADYKEGYRMPDEDPERINYIKIAQHLTLFWSVYHMYNGEWEPLKQKMAQLLDDTKRNVEHALFIPGNYPPENDWSMMHLPEGDKYEPLSWLCHEFPLIPSGTARKLFVDAYEEFALFLREQEKKDERTCASYLRKKTESRLKTIAERLLNEIALEEEDRGGTGPDTKRIAENKALYDSMMDGVLDRVMGLREDVHADPGGDSDESDVEEPTAYMVIPDDWQ